MSKISPFKAYRFTCSDRQLKSEVCPPYDIIPPTLEKSLHSRNFNAIQVELPKGNPKTKYENAHKIWRSWIKKGVVTQDTQEAIYLYEQTFRVQGKIFSRRGFFCALALEKPGAGSVLRHELTLAKPKEDRMHLLTALNVNTSPIFGIFKDRKKEVRNLIKIRIKNQPQVQFRDAEDITHKIWLIRDESTIKCLKKIIAKEPVLIADGHHRYETAWSYSKVHPEIKGAKSVLFFLSPIGDPGLVVFPTHRILLRDQTLGSLLSIVSGFNKCFTYREIKNLSRSFRTLSPFDFIVSDGKKHFQIQCNSIDHLKKLIPGKSLPSIEHPLVQIHSLLLPSLKKEDFLYVHTYEEALELTKKLKKLALIIPPTSIDHMYKIVESGEVMPQKSTYFYPKIWSGLLFRSLL